MRRGKILESLKIIIRKIKDGSIHEIWDEFRWMWSYGRKFKAAIIFYTILGMFSTLMSLVSAVAGKELINIVTGIQKNRALEMAVLMVCMSLFGLLFQQIMSRITLKINIRIKNSIQADIFDKIIRVNWKDLSSFHGGDLINRFDDDISTVAASAINWVPTLIINLFNFIATFVLILYYDVTMLFLMIVNAPVMMISSRFLLGKMRKHNLKVKEMNSEMMAFESETFMNMDSIKSFGLADMFGKKLHYYQNKYKDINLEYNMFGIKTNTVMSLIGMTINFTFYGWAVYRLWTGEINYGEMVLFLQQSGRMAGIFSALVGIIPSTITSTTSAKRLMEIVELTREDEDPVKEDELKREAAEGYNIVIDNADYSYTEGRPVLKNVSLEGKKGEIVALVGPSGEGKTTIIRMILGLIKPDKGKSYLVTESGREYDFDASTRKFFSYVPQGNVIFSGTIAHNLRMVKEDATDEEVITALKTACAYDFVSELEEGIYTVVGNGGAGLSEGQKQRIAIARAVLKDAPVLLLDEATSALDVTTERKVLQNIIVANPNKLCIVTTHRPSVLSMCNRVYRVRNCEMTMLDEEEAARLAMEW